MSTLITVVEAARLLGISNQRVRTLCRTGTLKSRKAGRTWLISQQAAQRYGLKSGHRIAEDHGMYSISSHADRKPVALSFFSGAMGLDLGVERAGFDVRLACEVDKYCRQTIALNRPNLALLGDITTCTAQAVRAAAGLSIDDDVDLVIGGPPCQAFSSAGRRHGLSDRRGNVFLTYVRLALAIRPKYIVIENVRGLLSCPAEPAERAREERARENSYNTRGGALRLILETLRSAGYGVSFNLYNSANFGTPQVRERVIMVCSRDGTEAPYLEPTNSDNSSVGLPRWVTLKECVNGIRSHHHINFPEKRLRYYRMLRAGENWRSLPPKLQEEALGNSYYAGGGKTGFLRRLAWDKPSPTLVTHPAMPATDLAHPTEDRPLSIEEYKRIQQFPDTWELAGPLIQQYKQVGNAVPVGLGVAVGALIIKLLHGQHVTQLPGYKYSRYANTAHTEWAKSAGDSSVASCQHEAQGELELR